MTCSASPTGLCCKTLGLVCSHLQMHKLYVVQEGEKGDFTSWCHFSPGKLKGSGIVKTGLLI